MLLIDNSAWARLDSPALPAARRDEIAALIESGEIAVCAPFLLEARWSARNDADHDALLTDLLQLPYLAIDATVESAVACRTGRAVAQRANGTLCEPRPGQRGATILKSSAAI